MRADAQPRDDLAVAQPGPVLAGMGFALRAALGEALEEPNGLILVTGPQGSGRASTLAVLAAARSDAVVLPVIADRRDGGRAVEAARRNLVLAAAEAGDSIACLHLFSRFGIEPFPFARVLRLVLAQRQLRRLCPSCRARVQPPNAVTAPLGLDPGSVVWEAKGCEPCEGSGYRGRIAAFEAIPVDSEVGRLIVCGGEGAAIANHVFRTWPNLAAGVRALVAQGEVGAADALRLLRDAQRQ